MNWKGKRVLVTGAGGFIGSHLTERLAEVGALTRGFVRYNSGGKCGWLDFSPVRGAVEVIAGDICDRDCVLPAMRGVDVVFHLAALIGIPYSYGAPSSYVRTNVEGTLNVLEAARELGTPRIVHTSTSEVYGTARSVPITESHTLQAQSPYSATKIAADKLVEAFHLSYGLPAVTIRPFNTFGPRQSARAVIPTIITQCLTGTTVRLGNLTPTRDLNYVADTVEGFILAAQSQAAIGQVINIGTGTEISIGDLATKIAALMEKNVVVEFEAQRGRPDNSEVDRLCASNQRANEVLGWTPRYTLEEGLLSTIEWVRSHLDWYHPATYTV